MNYRALGPFGGGTDAEPPSVAILRKEVAALWDAYQDSRFGYVTGSLSDLLHRAQAAADHHDGDDPDQARRLSAWHTNSPPPSSPSSEKATSPGSPPTVA
ncbi:hypothetical protein OG559_08565 [Micromonospora sp. NBC_01405]|uniref:hypothetical protein n=1 Tax=Micromonospora sp. NBC_01405 TaxID=2903589 RepID=UPI003243CBD5